MCYARKLKVLDKEVAKPIGIDVDISNLVILDPTGHV